MWPFDLDEDADEHEGDSRVETSIKRVAKRAARDWLRQITITVLGVLGVSAVGIAGFVFWILPNAAYQRALEVVEIKTKSSYEQFDKQVREATIALAKIEGQTNSLNSELPGLKALNQQTKNDLGEIRSVIQSYRETVSSLSSEQAGARTAFLELTKKREDLAGEIKQLEERRVTLQTLVETARVNATTLQTDFEGAQSRLRTVNSYSQQEFDSFRSRVELLRAWGVDEEIKKKLQESFRIVFEFDSIARLVRGDRYGNEALHHELEQMKLVRERKDISVDEDLLKVRRDYETRVAALEAIVGKPTDQSKTLSQLVETLAKPLAKATPPRRPTKKKPRGKKRA